jgi:hypothetical protein
MLSPKFWSNFENSGGVPGGMIALRLHPESRFNLFAGYDKNSKKRIVSIKSGNLDLAPTKLLPAGRGFRVQYGVNLSDPDGASSLQFELTDPTFADVFDVIGNNVLTQILESADDYESFKRFVTQIEEWQSFLDALPSETLSFHARQGLFAELWFLQEYLLRDQVASCAVGSWAGPKSQAKDFQFAGLAVEVKSSSSKEHTRFTVNNEMQLDQQSVGKLFLCGILLEPLTAGGFSLPEVIAKIRSSLAGDYKVLRSFSDKLVQVGYRDADAQFYVERFSVRSIRFFDVIDGFPRIVGSDLRLGVGDVRYSILLSECERFRLLDEDARSFCRQAHL